MLLKVVQIPGREGNIAGLRYLPTDKRRETALLFAHGFTSAKHSLDQLANYLAMRGYEGLSIDFAGHKMGGTGGELHHITQAADNLRDALTWLQENSKAKRIVIVGHSMGAGCALAVAAGNAFHHKDTKTRREHEGGKGKRDKGKEDPNTQIPEDLTQSKIQNLKSKIQNPTVLAGIVCMCMGVGPSQGFDSAIGQAMLASRADYVAGAPPLQLIRELDEMILSASEVGDLPALFLAARQDVLVSVARVEALARMVGPQAKVEILDTSHLEAPDRAKSAVAQWLGAQGF